MQVRMYILFHGCLIHANSCGTCTYLYLHNYIRMYVRMYVRMYIHVVCVKGFLRSLTTYWTDSNERLSSSIHVHMYVHMTEYMWSPGVHVAS